MLVATRSVTRSNLALVNMKVLLLYEKQQWIAGVRTHKLECSR